MEKAEKKGFVLSQIVTGILMATILVALAGCGRKPTQNQKTEAEKPVTLLNVSYDPTRELYYEFNKAFAEHWREKTGQSVTILQSHGGSGSQARAVIDGLEADVVTLALAYDIDAINKNKEMLSKEWQDRLPHNSTPYYSTIVFLVRKDNPKNIKDWSDLVRPDVSVITPNPKISGGARWNYLAAWGYALKKYTNDATKAKEFVKRVYQNVPVLDAGARGATATFVKRGLGDVLIAWENEAFLAINETKDLGTDTFEIVYPSISILTEPPVAVIDAVVDRRGTRKVAEAYLEYLFSDQGQEIVARHFFRPRNKEIAKKHASQFPTINLFTIDEVFGGWANAQKKHFDEGGIFDQIFLTK